MIRLICFLTTKVNVIEVIILQDELFVPYITSLIVCYNTKPYDNILYETLCKETVICI